MSRRPCRNLIQLGDCSDDDDCSFEHSLPFCETCDRYFDSLKNLHGHIAGAAHRTRLAARNAEVIHLPDGRIVCRGCKTKMKAQHWDGHVDSPKHVAKVKFRLAQDSNAVAQSSKGGVELDPEGDVDFGLIEFEELTEQTAKHSPTRFVKVTARDESVLLKEVRFRESVANASGRRYFSVQSYKGQSAKIRPNKSLNVSVHFLPRNEIGSYEDVLVFDFETVPKSAHGRTEEFSIERTVRGRVGIKSDVEQFSAKAPYVKPDLENRPRADRKSVVSAPKDEFKQNKPWTGKLPFFATPKWILRMIETTSIGERISQTRRGLGTLSYQNYANFWFAVLHFESYQEELDVRRYDMSNVSLRKTGGDHFYLKVPGLAEKRPSVLRSDKIRVQTRTSSDKRWYEGIVTVVEDAQVLLKFNKSFAPQESDRFDVQFSISRIPTRRQLQALEGPLPRSHLLFPTLGLQAAFTSEVPFKFSSKAIESNAAQKQAVTSIVNNTSGKAPYVVFGPPGTGKTVTIIEACHQLVKHLDATILLTAPSNSAADLLCSRLILPPGSVFRLNAPSRMIDEVPQAVLKLSCVEDGTFSCPEVSQLSQYRVIVSTCISASILRGVGLAAGFFSHIFIDEAGQATEPEAFLPLSLAGRDTSVVLAGDPKQLGPIVRSPVSRALGLETSLLERFMSTPQYNQDSLEYRGMTYTKLVQNYRNHAAILKTSNDEFYAGELKVCASKNVTSTLQAWEGWPNPEFPIIFHSVKGRDEREGASPSFFNVAEISTIRHYVDSIKKSKRVRVLDSDIGIITPYQSQCTKLRTALGQHQRPKLTIGTVEQFQGSERSVILMSTVRSNKEFLEQDKRFAIGFLGNAKRFNVAVTRPQAGLIVVGDPDILAIDPLWRRFLLYVHDNGGWRGQSWDPEPFRDAGFDPVKTARDEMANLSSRFGALDGLGMDD